MWESSHCLQTPQTPEEEALAVLWPQELGNRVRVGRKTRGKAGKEKVLSIDSEWRKVSSRFPSSLLDKEASVEMVEEDLGSRPQIKRFPDPSTQARSINMHKSREASDLNCTYFQRMQGTLCTQSGVGRAAFLHEVCQIKPL